MRYRSFFLIAIATLSLPACSTTIDGQTQEVRIDMQGAYEGECVLNNGVRYVATNGETITVQRSHKPLEMDCYAAGNRHVKKTVESSMNGWTAAFPPGAVYDHFSGGLYTYPPIITVDFVGVPTRGFELPDYHNKDAPNPYKQPIEIYDAGTPRVHSDTAYLKRGLEKRDSGADNNPFADSAAPEGTNVPDKPSGAGITPLPVLKGGNADELTRSMNPTVFNK